MRQLWAEALDLARAFVRGKVRNSRTLLRRNHPEAPKATLQEMARLANRASTAPDLARLLGIEGAAARAYFSRFGELLRPPSEGGARLTFDFQGRNRRPPRDPVNAMLSFLYAILTKDVAVTALAVGFDPYLGFLHQPRYGRPALALDLCEEFRPLIVDSTVVRLVNNGEIGAADFVRHGEAAALTPVGRKKVIDAYERRMDQLVSHPLFGYAVSYRRVLEIQLRILGRTLLGEIPRYQAFETR